MTRILSGGAVSTLAIGICLLAPAWGGDKGKEDKGKEDSGAKIAPYHSKELSFQVSFPDKPIRKEQNVGGLEQTIFFVERKKGAFFVFHQVNPPIEKGQEREVLKKARDGIGTVGTVTKSSEITLDKTYPGIEVYATVKNPPGAEVIDRIYLVENKLYQVMVLGEPAFVNSDEAKAFLDSFKYMPGK